jgi:hypothetical protein
VQRSPRTRSARGEGTLEAHPASLEEVRRAGLRRHGSPGRAAWVSIAGACFFMAGQVFSSKCRLGGGEAGQFGREGSDPVHLIPPTAPSRPPPVRGNRRPRLRNGPSPALPSPLLFFAAQMRLIPPSLLSLPYTP